MDNSQGIYHTSFHNEDDPSGSGDGEPMYAGSGTFRNAPRMWRCAYCGGCEPDTRGDNIMTKCTSCGGPRQVMEDDL